MFEAAELGSRVDRDTYDERVDTLRVELLNAQFDLRDAPFPVLLLVTGDDRPGVNDLVNLIHKWMDGRHIETHALRAPTQEERERPRLWRFWRRLPMRGRIGLFVGGWVSAPLVERLADEIDDVTFDRRLVRIQRFEQLLADDGALVLKFWLHLPPKPARKRLSKDGDTGRADILDHALLERREDMLPLADALIRRTSTAATPWEVVESTDARHRNLAVMETLLAAFQRRLAAAAANGEAQPSAATPTPAVATPPVLESVDLSAKLAYDDYKKTLRALQRDLREVMAQARERDVSSVIVFEGQDAAGKGGVIRRLTAALDAWDYRVFPIAAPSDEEAGRHYLWRFWRRLPRAGRMVIFDRSWYGRVLVERVEGLAREDEWRRAYAEINDFEEQLVSHGMPVLKFWLHIDPDEQLRRFRARERTPYKKYKLTEDDYRNREHWEDYLQAVNETVARTSTGIAPWHVVAANDKRFARVEVLRHVHEGLRQAVKAR